jgi:hypothetical protein
MLATKRRMAAGKYPRAKEAAKQQTKGQKDSAAPSASTPWLQDQDCSIVDSLVVYFRRLPEGESKPLLFCTNNVKDFGRMSDDGKGSLNRRFQEGLPVAQVFTTLKALVEFVKAKGTVETPTKEQVEAEKKQEIEEELEQTSVSGGGSIGDFYVVESKPIEAHLSSLGLKHAVLDENLTRYRIIPPMRLGGVYRGPILVREAESDPSQGQPFSDTSYVSPPPKNPVEGTQVFDAANLGDEPPKPKPESESPPKQ